MNWRRPPTRLWSGRVDWLATPMGGLSEFFLLNDALYMMKVRSIQMALEHRIVRLTGLLELRVVLCG